MKLLHFQCSETKCGSLCIADIFKEECLKMTWANLKKFYFYKNKIKTECQKYYSSKDCAPVSQLVLKLSQYNFRFWFLKGFFCNPHFKVLNVSIPVMGIPIQLWVNCWILLIFRGQGTNVNHFSFSWCLLKRIVWTTNTETRNAFCFILLIQINNIGL